MLRIVKNPFPENVWKRKEILKYEIIFLLLVSILFSYKEVISTGNSIGY